MEIGMQNYTRAFTNLDEGPRFGEGDVRPGVPPGGDAEGRPWPSRALPEDLPEAGREAEETPLAAVVGREALPRPPLSLPDPLPEWRPLPPSGRASSG